MNIRYYFQGAPASGKSYLTFLFDSTRTRRLNMASVSYKDFIKWVEAAVPTILSRDYYLILDGFDAATPAIKRHIARGLALGDRSLSNLIIISQQPIPDYLKPYFWVVHFEGNPLRQIPDKTGIV